MVKKYRDIGNNALSRIARPDPFDKFEVEVGDSKQPEFYPQVKIKRWDNEANASVRFLDSEPKQLSVEGDVVKLVGQKKEVRFYELPKKIGPEPSSAPNRLKHIKVDTENCDFVPSVIQLFKSIDIDEFKVVSINPQKRWLFATGFYSLDKYIYPENVPKDIQISRNFSRSEAGILFEDQGTIHFFLHGAELVTDEKIFEAIKETTSALGVEVVKSPHSPDSNDLVFRAPDGKYKKFCGIWRDGSVLGIVFNVDTSPAELENVFRLDTEKMKRREGAEETSDVFGGLREVKADITVQEVRTIFAEKLSGKLPVSLKDGEFTEEEEAKIQKYQEIFSNSDWIYNANEPLEFFEFYDNPYKEGGFEFEIILKEPLESNKIEFSVQSKELKLSYQPPLTKEEKNKGLYRPIHVIGSYAVYHKNKRNNYSKVGGKNYKCGKAFHIYRPLIYDSAGKKCWGELSFDVDRSVLTVTIPQEFIDNAVYPIRQVAGTVFGYDTVGSSASYALGDTVVGGAHTTSAAFDVDDIQFYGEMGGTSDYYEMGIYLDSNDSLVANSDTEGAQASAATQWWKHTYGTKPSLANATKYKLAAMCDNPKSTHDIYCDSNGGEGFYNGDGTYPGMPDPLENYTDDTNNYSIYCTYSAGAPAAPPEWPALTGSKFRGPRFS